VRVRDFLKSQLEKRAPALFNGIRAVRNRRYFRQQFSQLHADTRERLFPNNAPIVVQSGPFRGLRYFDEIVWGSITPKWLGSYEAELHPIVAQIANRTYATIVDVGCAEGYYAVGLAVNLPLVKVIAFDTDYISRRQVCRLARLNHVADRVFIREFCDHAALNAFSGGKTLVVCDVEGFEAELLNPEAAASLRHNDILVEIHEACDYSPLVEPLIVSRFAETHGIQRIVAADRDSWVEVYHQQLPPTVSRDLLRRAAEENRNSGRVWLWMEANQS
jgi:hypothetical protein